MLFVQEDYKEVEKIKIYKLVNMYSYMNITISIDKNKIYGKSSVNEYWADCKIENDKIEKGMLKINSAYAKI